MDSYKRTGIICVNQSGLQFRVCVLNYFLNRDGTFKYTFIPNYSVISLLNDKEFQGIPGLNLTLNEREYIRENITPTFVTERVPSEKREDLFDLLAKVSLDFIDPIEYLIRTDKKYSGDDLYVIPYEENKIINAEEISKKNNVQGIMKFVLSNLSMGNSVYFSGIKIDDHNRKDIFNVLLCLYLKSLAVNKAKQKEGIEKSVKAKKYKGRKAIQVDKMVFLEFLERVNRGEISAKEAASKLEISIDKYYRLKKALQK